MNASRPPEVCQEREGILSYGGVRMALLDVEAGFWSLSRQVEALLGRRIANATLHQAGANGGASFARSFAPAGASDSASARSEAFRACLTALQAAGFGRLGLERLDWESGAAVVTARDSMEAWMLLRHGRTVPTPACAYLAGVLTGFVQVLSGRKDLVYVERACEATGAQECRFELIPAAEAEGTAAVAVDPDPFVIHQAGLVETLFEQIPVGIAIFDRELILRRCNPTWAGFLERYGQVPRHQVVAGLPYRQVAPAAWKATLPHLERALRGETVHLKRFQIDGPGGSSYWDLTLAPLEGGQGPTGAVTVGIDVTEQVRAYQTLEQRVEERTRELALSLQTSHRQADEMRTLLAIQQAITGASDPQDVLQRISDEARRLTNARRALIFLVDGDDLAVSVWSGEDNPAAVEGFRMPIRSSATGRMMLAGRPLRVNDAPGDPQINREILRRTGFRSLLSVPLISGSTPMGAISCADKIDGAFDDADERVLSMLASGAVLGIQNARLHWTERERRQEAEERRRVAESLRDTLRLLNSAQPLQGILEHLVRQAADLLGADTGALYRLQPGGNVFTIQAAVGLPQELVASLSMPVELGAVGRAIQQKRPVVISDLAQVFPPHRAVSPGLREYLEWLSGRFWGVLGLPIGAGDEVYGGFVLHYREPRAFTQEELAVASSLGDQAALAIQNAHLRSQAEASAVAAERSRLARDLHDAVTQTLFSANLIADVLPRLWERRPEEGWRRLEELRQLTRGALAEMRTLLMELRPAALVEARLPDLIRHLAEAVTGRARIPVEVHVEGEGRLLPEVQVAFYRIAQEALNNVAHHAAAEHVRVTLRCSASGVALRVEDDGRGFDVGKVPAERLGLGIMRERAQAIGARIRIESQVGQGTRVMVEWEDEQGVSGG